MGVWHGQRDKALLTASVSKNNWRVGQKSKQKF